MAGCLGRLPAELPACLPGRGLSVGLFVVGDAIDPVATHALAVAFSLATGIAFILVPFAFVARLLRGRFAGDSVGRLVAELGPAPAQLRDVLRDVRGDPTLELGYWLPELSGYVDIDGRPFDPHAEGAATVVDVSERCEHDETAPAAPVRGIEVAPLAA